MKRRIMNLEIVKRFQKRRLLKQYTARLEAKPGVTNIVLTHNGKPYMHVVLTTLVHDRRDGASASFVDYSHFMERTRIR